jgi:phage terminase Nu1 subunit (DNA packaging protein)
MIDMEKKYKRDTVEEHNAQKLRLTQHKADLAELQLLELQGTLLKACDVEATWLKLTAAFRSQLMSLPARVSSRLAAMRDVTEIHELLTKQLNETLKELSHYEPENLAYDPPESPSLRRTSTRPHNQ